MLIMKKGSGDILASITAAVDDTEKNVKKLRSVWEGYFRNQERLRKKTLKLASFFRNFGDAEGGSTRELVHIISDTLLQCSELKLSSAKVFDPLGVLPDITRRVKVDVKNWESYSKVERKLQLQLQAAVLKDPTAETVGALKKNADNASLAVANGTKNVTTTASDYQREKYNSIKTACLQFLWNEMTTCARRLELVSAGYEQIHRTTGEFQDISGTLKKVLNAYRGATIGSIDSPTYTTRSEASSPALRSATSSTPRLGRRTSSAQSRTMLGSNAGSPLSSNSNLKDRGSASPMRASDDGLSRSVARQGSVQRSRDRDD